VVLEGAGDPGSVRALGTTLDEDFSVVGSRYVVLGMLAGRDADAAVVALAGARPDLVICTTADGPRGLPAADVAAACDRAGMANESVADPLEAVGRALSLVAEEDVVVVTGSFRLLTPARAVVTAVLGGPVADDGTDDGTDDDPDDAPGWFD
jgi:folylpolyglutamate synthase/dihydropteroate synthase